MGQRLKNLESYIQEAIKNIRNDRDVTSTLLADLLMEINKTGSTETHKDLGFIASKYVETLQRSNEQLVKLTSILSKKQDGSIRLDEQDKNELFDIIQGEATGGKQ
tara:strand:- start:1270 stop:1587 length:318 start_codon:yes stop_codon:yes gene_type:complete